MRIQCLIVHRRNRPGSRFQNQVILEGGLEVNALEFEWRGKRSFKPLRMGVLASRPLGFRR